MSSRQNSTDQKTNAEFLKILDSKPTIEDLTDMVCCDTSWIPVLFDIIKSDSGSRKFACDKIIRKISEKDPKCIYPYFDEVADLISSSNSFIKWGAIVTLSNLVSVDSEEKFPPVYERYFDLIQSDAMITAANVVGNAWKIVDKYPQYETDITKRLLQVTEHVYLNKGELSPECQRILCGHVLDCFDRYYERSANQSDMIEFAKKLTDCSRHAVAKKAQDFLKHHKEGSKK